MMTPRNTQPTKDFIKIIPLGGLGEVGRNMMVLEHRNDIVIVDTGLGFPEENMPGVDFVIPNVNYLKNKLRNIRGIVFTHGHYDHIGALPYLIEKLGNPPLFASNLTAGIIRKRHEDFENLPRLKLKVIKKGDVVRLGVFSFEFFKQAHTIADNMGLFIETPVGNIVHTSDFKFDETPMYDEPTDFNKLKELSQRGVHLLMSDSTGAEEEGHSLSEKAIFENLEKIFIQRKNSRIIAATFASLINRIQQLITLSEKYGRKVIIEGHTMRMNIEISKKLGYVKAKKGTFIRSDQVNNYPDEKITIICTGAQGEEKATLMKIITKEHRYIRIHKNDTIIFSSSVIPGNERSVQMLKDNLLKQGAKVYHYKMMDIHASGHGRKEELGQMIEIMRPKFFLPIHGQYSMMAAHKELAIEKGIPENNIVVAENGDCVRLYKDKIELEKQYTNVEVVMIDGLGSESLQDVVIRDRQTLAKEGIFVIITIVDKNTGKVKNSPDIISRGFVYLRESKDLLKESRKITIHTIEKYTLSGKVVNWAYLKNNIKNNLEKFLYSKTGRKPVIIPVIIEV
ncbi:Ribonuclease J1 [bacterium HR34]|nr:Ribonuclease J1 [bacterium HR34]